MARGRRKIERERLRDVNDPGVFKSGQPFLVGSITIAQGLFFLMPRCNAVLCAYVSCAFEELLTRLSRCSSSRGDSTVSFHRPDSEESDQPAAQLDSTAY